ncbi:hypothetical protein BDV93DRAFT_528415 [Ceratobasidium sp. AG-I]|nr:hypothetical protein BDV93DRAFT_528415 [Ceratobasidium sp. AG-I]
MYSRAVAACSRAAVHSHVLKTSRPAILFRLPPRICRTPGLRQVRHYSAAPLEDSSRTALVYAPDRSQLEANEEFSETDPVPPEEATLNITQAASEQLRRIGERESEPGIALRVLVESGGCHGYQYKMELTTGRESTDYHFVRPPTGAVGVVVDPVSLSLLKGSTIDFATELIGSSFRVAENPQATGKGCGCGVSWELKE